MLKNKALVTSNSLVEKTKPQKKQKKLHFSRTFSKFAVSILCFFISFAKLLELHIRDSKTK